jgi:methyl-accepting chemotaxis protein
VAGYGQVVTDFSGEPVGVLEIVMDRSEYAATVAATRNWVLGITAVAVLLALAVGWLIARSITTPVRETLGVLEDIAEGDGDLTRRLDTTGRDEVAGLADAFNRFADKIHDLVARARDSAGGVTRSSHEIAEGNENLSQRTEEQASSLEETASSMEEMTTTVRQNADNAREADRLVGSARGRAEQGGAVAGEAVAAMGEISEASRRIAEIIGTIDEIAFQTNLLALNAAVEAARAGEQGRGFAVVAGEVRKLAGRSAESARDIKDLIEDSVGKIERGTGLVNESGKTLEEIVHSVQQVNDIVSEIAAASQEQSAGIEQVNKAVMQMDEMTQQNAALVEQAAAASKSLQDQAGELDELMGAFRIAETPVRIGHAGGARSEVAAATKAKPAEEASGGHRQPAKPAGRAEAPRPTQSTSDGHDDEWEEF